MLKTSLPPVSLLFVDTAQPKQIEMHFKRGVFSARTDKP